jgi:cystathionine beta-lyase family protein involved in aluminum resistance
LDLRSEEWGRLGVGPRVVEAALAAERETAGRCAEIERTAAAWELRVLDAFHAERVSDYYLHGSTGYGYNDVGREALDRIYARVFGADAGLVRPQFISGTHALGVAVHGVLSPGDTVVIGNGMPYDTMQQVMGIGAGAGRRGSLADRGVNVRVMPLTAQDEVDVEAVKAALTTEPKMFYLQKSRGYAWREALSYEDIRCLFALAKEISPKTICFVDNCYGELVDEHEMGNAGADLFAGSLIKNPGGGLARTGGYICGRADLVERAAERLSVPGLSMDMGATGGYQELFYQGLFLAPHVVGQALQGAVVSSRLFELLGFETCPLLPIPGTILCRPCGSRTLSNCWLFAAVSRRRPQWTPTRCLSQKPCLVTPTRW